MKCINCDNRISTLGDICPFCIEDLRGYKRANGHKILHPEKSYAELVAMIEEQPRPPGFDEYMRDSGVYRQERLSSCVINREELLREIELCEVKVEKLSPERQGREPLSSVQAKTGDPTSHSGKLAELQPLLEQDKAHQREDVRDNEVCQLGTMPRLEDVASEKANHVAQSIQKDTDDDWDLNLAAEELVLAGGQGKVVEPKVSEVFEDNKDLVRAKSKQSSDAQKAKGLNSAQSSPNEGSDALEIFKASLLEAREREAQRVAEVQDTPLDEELTDNLLEINELLTPEENNELSSKDLQVFAVKSDGTEISTTQKVLAKTRANIKRPKLDPEREIRSLFVELGDHLISGQAMDFAGMQQLSEKEDQRVLVLFEMLLENIEEDDTEQESPIDDIEIAIKRQATETSDTVAVSEAIEESLQSFEEINEAPIRPVSEPQEEIAEEIDIKKLTPELAPRFRSLAAGFIDIVATAILTSTLVLLVYVKLLDLSIAEVFVHFFSNYELFVIGLAGAAALPFMMWIYQLGCFLFFKNTLGNQFLGIQFVNFDRYPANRDRLLLKSLFIGLDIVCLSFIWRLFGLRTPSDRLAKVYLVRA